MDRNVRIKKFFLHYGSCDSLIKGSTKFILFNHASTNKLINMDMLRAILEYNKQI